MPDTNELLRNAQEQFNILMGNMFQFNDEDMALYDRCYADVFKDGINFSYMSATFYAQFASEILLAALSSNPFRKFVVHAIEEERGRTEPGTYWDESMEGLRFGIEGKDYEADTKELTDMMNVSYVKIMSLNNWYGTKEGKEEFEMYCLSKRAVKDIKSMVCELPYLLRHFDFDAGFAKEIMEYAGIVANQIREMDQDGNK